jgi:hypothetical protein
MMVSAGLVAIVYSLMIYRKMKFEKKKENKNPFHINKDNLNL